MRHHSAFMPISLLAHLLAIGSGKVVNIIPHDSQQPITEIEIAVTLISA